MNTIANIKAVSEIAASQMGLFTTAQAVRFGVSRNVLAHMAKMGRIERLAQGVYCVSGTPYHATQGIYAAWLSTAPALMAHERLERFDGIVAGGHSAAAIHGIGDFFVSPYHFFTHERFNSKRQGVFFTKRSVAHADVTFTDFGLPVTSITRTIFDLKCDNEEPSLLFGALVDALQNKTFDAKRLKELFIECPVARCSLSELDYENMMKTARG